MKFRPQNLPKFFIMRERLKTGKLFNYNWQDRTKYVLIGDTVNKRVLRNIFGQLHYRACHAPIAVQKRWGGAYRRFRRMHLPDRGSMNFLNNWTAHSWL